MTSACFGEILFNHCECLITVCLHYFSMIICISLLCGKGGYDDRGTRARGGKSWRRENKKKHQEKTKPSSPTRTLPSKEGEDHKYNRGKHRSKAKRPKMKSSQQSKGKSLEMHKSIERSNEPTGRDKQSDKLKNFPQPKVLKATQKEKQIAAGAKRKSTDYPTMDEILSDWDENDEAANQLKKKASLDCVTAKNAVPNSAEQAVPVNVNNVVAIGKCFSISGWNRFV
ncbi:hypothetical protein Y032_0168g165 [Ancylostoma ceylanicum]|uniref:Uncharacterized protein n=1 Tax=Ancylostoma ceylanicum TaxID=53326 RepID=A0A016SWB1_9BILA|nr:hypothetical protein Y032_0168g165 [Ancylostoma ceylanicum]